MIAPTDDFPENNADPLDDGEGVTFPDSGGSSEGPLRFGITPELAGRRLDAALAALAGGALSRTRLSDLIRAGAVTGPDGAAQTDPSRKVAAGDTYAVVAPDPVPSEILAEDIPLNILYEDEHLLVIDKPAGLVVHPGAGHWSGTLVNALLHHCGASLSGIGGVQRPGIVHRLDRETSGVMLAAKTDAAHRALAAQLADRTLSRVYRALVLGRPVPPLGTIDVAIGRHPSDRLKMAAGTRGGRAARTHYRVLESFGEGASLVECHLESGRTHQIRVHMAHIRHPVIGDPLYGPQKTALSAALRRADRGEDAVAAALTFQRQALHACRISFIHPESGEEMEFSAPLPPDMAALLDRIGGEGA